MTEDSKRTNESVALAMIGRRIQIARNKRRVTVARLSAKTAISIRFIEYIEAGEFSKLPGRSHVLGFTRAICRELGLDPDEIVHALKSEMYLGQDMQLKRVTPPMKHQSNETQHLSLLGHILSILGNIFHHISIMKK
jgi:cytoskeletal protein RodZ